MNQINYSVVILSQDDKIIDNTILIGSKEKMTELAHAFYDIKLSLEPEKYKYAKPALIPVEDGRVNS